MISCYCTVSPGKLQHTAGGTANFFDLFFPSTPASSPGPAGGPAPSGPPIPRHDLSTFPRLPAHRRRPSIPRPGTSPPPVAPAALPWTFSRAVRGIALLFSLPALFFCGLYRFPTLNRCITPSESYLSRRKTGPAGDGAADHSKKHIRQTLCQKKAAFICQKSSLFLSHSRIFLHFSTHFSPCRPDFQLYFFIYKRVNYCYDRFI